MNSQACMFEGQGHNNYCLVPEYPPAIVISCSVNRRDYVVPLFKKATFHLPVWVTWCNVCPAVCSPSTLENTLHYTTNIHVKFWCSSSKNLHHCKSFKVLVVETTHSVCFLGWQHVVWYAHTQHTRLHHVIIQKTIKYIRTYNGHYTEVYTNRPLVWTIINL